ARVRAQRPARVVRDLDLDRRYTRDPRGHRTAARRLLHPRGRPIAGGAFCTTGCAPAALNDRGPRGMLAGMRERAVLVIAAVVAWGAPQRSRMYPAGSDKDDGYGDLARMSARLSIGGSGASPFAAPRARRTSPEADPGGGDSYGGASDDDATTDGG